MPKKPTYWLFVIRDNGNMEIYFMPDMKLAYLVTNVGNGNHFLSDSMEFVPLSLTQQNGESNIDGGGIYQICKDDTIPTEIFISGLGSYARRPVMFVRMKNEIFIYQVFRYPRGHLKIRFKKLNHSILIPVNECSEHMDTDDETNGTNGSKNYIRTIRYFGV